MGDIPHRILLSYAAPEAFAPMTRAILAKLGYAILLPNEFDAVVGDSEVRPAIQIVDERQLADVPDDGDAIPIIVIAGRHGVTGADSRIIGAVRRPAGMHELYRLVQQVTEQTPRSTPRIPTHLTVQCRRDTTKWASTILSISENGCLIRSPEPLNLGSRFEVTLSLPLGEIDLDAEVAYQLLPDHGLIFHAITTRDRDQIITFMNSALLAGGPVSLEGSAR